MKTWVYFVECTGGFIYVGVARNPRARFESHKAGRGARHLRLRSPLRLIGAFPLPSRREALVLERQIKRIPRLRKLAIAQFAARCSEWQAFTSSEGCSRQENPS